LTELAAEHRRVSEIAAVLRLESVDEHSQRPTVVELVALYVERQAGKARKFRDSPTAVNPLDTAVERGQHAGDPVDRPDAVELTHAQ